jgi:hypothetical protein
MCSGCCPTDVARETGRVDGVASLTPDEAAPGILAEIYTSQIEVIIQPKLVGISGQVFPKEVSLKGGRAGSQGFTLHRAS